MAQVLLVRQPACHRHSATYGDIVFHEKINDATHALMGDLVPEVNSAFLKGVAPNSRADDILDTDDPGTSTASTCPCCSSPGRKTRCSYRKPRSARGVCSTAPSGPTSNARPSRDSDTWTAISAERPADPSGNVLRASWRTEGEGVAHAHRLPWGGWAAAYLVKSLRKAIKRGDVKPTVVSRENYHTFHGFIPEMLVGRIQPRQLVTPARWLFNPAHFQRFPRVGRGRNVWSLQDSNLRHPRCERGALPAELSDLLTKRVRPGPLSGPRSCVHTPTGTRTPVSAVRGRYPRPLDDKGVHTLRYRRAQSLHRAASEGQPLNTFGPGCVF